MKLVYENLCFGAIFLQMSIFNDLSYKLCSCINESITTIWNT